MSRAGSVLAWGLVTRKVSIMPKWILVTLTELGVAQVYTCMAWVLAQVAAQILPLLEVPTLIIRMFVVLLLLGLPVTLVFAWRPISRRVN